MVNSCFRVKPIRVWTAGSDEDSDTMAMFLQLSTSVSSARSRRKEDVEDDCKQQEEDIAHDAEPEARITQEFLVVVTEEHVADGHSCDSSTDVSYKRHLRQKTQSLDEKLWVLELKFFITPDQHQEDTRVCESSDVN